MSLNSASFIRRTKQYFSECCWWAIEDEPTGIYHVMADSTQWLERSVSNLPGSIIRVFASDRLPPYEEEEVGRMLFRQPSPTLIFWGDSAASAELLRSVSRLMSMARLRVIVVYLSARERGIGQAVRQELKDDDCHKLAAAMRDRPNSSFIDLTTNPSFDEDYPILPLALPPIKGVGPWPEAPRSGMALMLQEGDPTLSTDLPISELCGALGVNKIVLHAPSGDVRTEPNCESCDLLALNGLESLAQVSDVLIDLARRDGYGYLTRLALTLGKPFLSTWRWPRQFASSEIVQAMTISSDYDEMLLRDKAAEVRRLVERPYFAKELASLAMDYSDLFSSQWAHVMHRSKRSHW